MMNRTISALLLAGTLGTLTSPVIAQECKLRVTAWGGSYQKTCESIAADSSKPISADRVGRRRQPRPSGQGAAPVRSIAATNTLLNSIAGEKEGLWLALDSAKIPNMANLYPNAVHSPYTVFVNVGDYVLAYNADKVKAAPTSWDELWKPDYKKTMSSSTASSTSRRSA